MVFTELVIIQFYPSKIQIVNKKYCPECAFPILKFKRYFEKKVTRFYCQKKRKQRNSCHWNLIHDVLECPTAMFWKIKRMTQPIFSREYVLMIIKASNHVETLKKIPSKANIAKKLVIHTKRTAVNSSSKLSTLRL